MNAQAPKFQKDSDHDKFSSELRRRVNAYFVEARETKHADIANGLKALFLFLMFSLLYSTLVFVDLNTTQIIGLSLLTGIVVDLIGLNVLHECAHGNFFQSVKRNKLSGYLMDFFGISVDIYRIKHIEVHHRYTNIHHWDGDVDEAYPLIRLSDKKPRLALHRFQQVYAFLLYSLVTFSWVTSDDFRRLAKMKVCDFKMPAFSHGRQIRIVTLKALHLTWAIGIPSLFHPLTSVLAVYFCIHLLMGLGITIVFQLAHVFEHSSFEDNPETKTSYGDWMVHQLKTTADFATGNPWVNALLGGLNLQVEHHLFPGISQRHLPAIQKIVRATCQEYGIVYHEYPSCLAALGSHFRLLKKLGAPS